MVPKLDYLEEINIILANDLDWLDPLMCLLENSPNLKVVFVDQIICIRLEVNMFITCLLHRHLLDLRRIWHFRGTNRVLFRYILSAHLEIFEWKGYRGRSKDKELLTYILANSMCLKRAGISMTRSRDRNKMMKELESTSSQLLFSTQLEYLNVQNEMTD
ncbi:unnamed protein product, partial [Thlaspi arvense]